MPSLIHIAIHIKPTPVFTNEATDFMHTLCRLAALAIPRDKLNDGAITAGFVSTHLKPQPTYRRGLQQLHRIWARAGMPRCQKIISQLQCVSAIARTHQRSGISRGRAQMQRFTAVQISATATRAKRMILWHVLHAGDRRYADYKHCNSTAPHLLPIEPKADEIFTQSIGVIGTGALIARHGE